MLSAYDETSPYRNSVMKGYPQLFEHMSDIKAAGVDFHDFTGLFSNITDTCYLDTCCHLNKNGYDLVAREIGRIINSTSQDMDQDSY